MWKCLQFIQCIDRVFGEFLITEIKRHQHSPRRKFILLTIFMWVVENWLLTACRDNFDRWFSTNLQKLKQLKIIIFYCGAKVNDICTHRVPINWTDNWNRSHWNALITMKDRLNFNVPVEGKERLNILLS